MKLCIITLLGSVGLASIAGCSNAKGASDAKDATETSASHQDAIAVCDAAHDEALANAGPPMDVKLATDAWQTCLQKANDAVVPRIESNLTDAGSMLAGTAASTIKQQRDVSGTVCDAIGQAVDPWEMNGSALDCSAQQEHDLGQLIDGYVALDAAAITLPDGRATYAACYGAYDEAKAAAANDGEAAQALFALRDCIDDQIRASETAPGGIVDAIAQNFPDQNRADIEANVKAAVDGAISAIVSGCDLFAAAGESSGGSLAISDSGACQVDAAVQLGAALAIVMPPSG